MNEERPSFWLEMLLDQSGDEACSRGESTDARGLDVSIHELVDGGWCPPSLSVAQEMYH